jgi:UPF0755 protein
MRPEAGFRGATRRSRALALAAAALLLAACGGEPRGEPIRFTVPAGAGMAAVADTLESRGILERATAFRLYARAKGAAQAIKPGIYEIRAGTAWSEILDKLVSGDVLTLNLVIPEGWTAAQIAERIAAVSNAEPDSVREYLFSPETAERLGVPGPTLEGYLYPATYRFPAGAPVADVVQRLVRRYQQVWTPELRARADSLGLSEREVVALASIVEKEAKQWGERDTIAAVYHNRLRIGMPLQADPTVQYALGAHQNRLLYSHIEEVADDPYNTYKRRGLPPGPIASPSAGAIQATLAPADVDYLYFVARPDGSHVFTRTLAEHNAAKRRSQRAARALAGQEP